MRSERLVAMTWGLKLKYNFLETEVSRHVIHVGRHKLTTKVEDHASLHVIYVGPVPTHLITRVSFLRRVLASV